MNTEELKRLAELNAGWSNANSAWNDMINEGGAVVGHIDEDGNKYDVAVVDLVQYDGFEGDSLQLAKFYAAANSAAVLELIRQLEHYKADSEASRHLLIESRKDEYCAMGWIASCRQAVGDDGSSDMPGFVEYLKLLKQQRNELLAALKVFADKYNSAPDGDLGIGLVNGDFFRAIDAIAKAESRK